METIEQVINQFGVNETLYAVELACLNKADALNERAGSLNEIKKWVSASNKINNARGEIGLL